MSPNRRENQTASTAQSEKVYKKVRDVYGAKTSKMQSGIKKYAYILVKNVNQIRMIFGDRSLNIEELSSKQFLDSSLDWNSALERSLDNHIFLTWEWLATWWKHYGSGRKFRCIIAKKNGDILAAMPLMVSPYRKFGFPFKKLEFLGSPVSDYHTFLVSQGHQQYIPGLLEYAEKNTKWDYLHLGDIPQESETSHLLQSMQDRKGLQQSTTNSYSVTLPHSFNDYYRTLSSGFRKKLRYGKNRITRNGQCVDFVVCNDKSDIPKAMASFFDLHKKRWQMKEMESSLASDPIAWRFLCDVALSFFDKGWLALNFLQVDDKPVAGGLDFIYGNKIYRYLSGFDPIFVESNVGHLRDLYFIKYGIDKGIKEFDFMRGDEPYKFKWNAEVKTNVHLRKLRSPIFRFINNLFLKWSGEAL